MKKIGFLQKQKKGYLFLSLATLAITYFGAVFFMYKYGSVYIDSDTSAEMILADLLNKEGRIITPNWYYSTEIHIGYPVQLYRLLLLIFPTNWHAVRTCSVAVLMALLALSYVYVGSKIGSLQASILTAAGLMCPFGYWYMFYGVFTNAYVIFMIKTLLIIGLLFDLQVKKSKVTSLLAYFSLCFLGGRGCTIFNECDSPVVSYNGFYGFLSSEEG